MKRMFIVILAMMLLLGGCEASLQNDDDNQGDAMGSAKIYVGMPSSSGSTEGGPMAAIKSEDIAYIELTVQPADIVKVLCGSKPDVVDGDDEYQEYTEDGDSSGACSFEAQGEYLDGDEEGEQPAMYDFDSLVMLPTGQQTFTAIAFDSSNNPVGVGSTQATVIANDTIDVYIEIKDSTGPIDGPKFKPIITEFTISKDNPVTGEQITLSVTAVDPDDDTMTYKWTDNCQAGSFTNSTSATTQWSSSKLDACDITITVSDGTFNASSTKSVTVYSSGGDSGSAQVQGVFVSHPFIYRVELEKSGNDCEKYSPNSYYGSSYYWKYRNTMDATCPEPFTVGGSYRFSAEAYVESGQAGHSWTFTSDCGGSFTNSYFEPNPQSGMSYYFAYWQAPSTPGVCILTAKLNNDGLIDEFQIAVQLVD